VTVGRAAVFVFHQSESGVLQSNGNPICDSMTITAKYEDGVFKPLEDAGISEGTIVEVRVPSYADRLKSKGPSVGDFAFYGMWKDRTIALTKIDPPLRKLTY